jgi:hypothetical protein
VLKVLKRFKLTKSSNSSKYVKAKTKYNFKQFKFNLTYQWRVVVFVLEEASQNVRDKDVFNDIRAVSVIFNMLVQIVHTNS